MTMINRQPLKVDKVAEKDRTACQQVHRCSPATKATGMKTMKVIRLL